MAEMPFADLERTSVRNAGAVWVSLHVGGLDGFMKLGQPQPDSYLSEDAKSGRRGGEEERAAMESEAASAALRPS